MTWIKNLPHRKCSQHLAAQFLWRVFSIWVKFMELFFIQVNLISHFYQILWFSANYSNPGPQTRLQYVCSLSRIYIWYYERYWWGLIIPFWPIFHLSNYIWLIFHLCCDLVCLSMCNTENIIPSNRHSCNVKKALAMLENMRK